MIWEGMLDRKKPGTPPRPEPVATADLVAQMREEAAGLEGWSWCGEYVALFREAAKALEDTAAERDDWRESHAIAAEAGRKLRAERDRALATLRDIADGVRPYTSARRLARERLEKP